MRKLYVDQLEEGMVLGKTIYNDRGDVLLARGVVLTQRFIRALQMHGFYAVYVLDGVADDVEPPEALSDKVRVATYKHVREIFSVVQSTAAQLGATKRAPSPGVELMPHVAQLYRDVEMIIDEVANAETLSGVVSLKSHDSYTYEHSIEVTVAGIMLGQRLHLSSNDVRQLALGCLCHDIGKTIVPPEILAKPDRLTPEEFALVKQHPQAGYDTMRQITGEDAVIARSVVWQHHERQDGTGYPRGLRGTNEFRYPSPPRFGQWLIVPAAEIAAVADVYSALASDRPYRPALETSEIIASLQKMAGPHLNRELVKRFLSMLPTYPVGSDVVVIAGKLQGHRGIVTEVSPSDIHRPIVRILFNPEGNKVTPFMVDTRVEKDVELAAPSYTKLAPAR